MIWKLCGAAVALFVTLVAGFGAIRLDAGSVQTTAFARPAAIPFPEDNPYAAAKAELGRRLFFDTLLSGGRDQSCASCHVPGLAWSDGLPRSRGRSDAPMPRRTPVLLDLAWQDRLGWDGKFPDLDRVAFTPITSERMMNLPEAEALSRLSAEPGYAVAFAAAFGDARVTRARVEAALATFERLIVSRPAPFDRFVAGEGGAIGEDARRGFALFTGKAGCVSCHSGWSFSDGSFHDIGTATGEDVGRGRLFPSSPALRYAFKTPALRGVAERGPFMHDGSLASLEAVIDLYDRGGIARPSRSPMIRPLHLDAREKGDLLAFLKSLSPDAAVPDLATALADRPMPAAAPAP